MMNGHTQVIVSIMMITTIMIILIMIEMMITMIAVRLFI